jgi:hypothetical protein
MTPDDFRELALSFSGAVEGQHMRHPDFRAHGRIFATLGYPDNTRGMVKLPLPEQKRFVEMHPEAFTPVKGAWGLQGSTSVLLSAAKRDVVAQALDLAWQYSATEAETKSAGAKAKPKKAASRTRVKTAG